MAWSFYVYELIDPRDGRPFYIGKGQRNRIEAHEWEAKAEKACSKKCLRIKEIWSAGLEIERRFVAFFLKERDAYAFEAARIEEIGLAALTNVVPGGRGGRLKRQRSLAVREPRIKMVPAKLVDWFPKNERLVSYLGYWLRYGKGVAKVTGPSPFMAQVMELIFNHLCPTVWEQINQDRELAEAMVPKLLPYGVKLIVL